MRLSLGNRMQKKSVSSAPIEGYLLVSVDSVCSKFFYHSFALHSPICYSYDPRAQYRAYDPN